jgi:membrane protease YdiL (CAAX protease family)
MESQTQRVKNIRAAHGLLLMSLTALPLGFPILRPWPWYLLVPLLAYGCLTLVIPALRFTYQWARVGRASRTIVIATSGIIIVSVTALASWAASRHPDLSDIRKLLPLTDPQLLLIVILAFAVLNAVMEEVVYRGVLLDALESRMAPVFAVIVQGVAFGFGHANGVPNGPLGIAMASVFGTALGVLRLKSGGLLACIICHVAADATIFALAVSSR